MKSYIGIIKLFGIFTIDSDETIVTKVRSNPEKWDKECLSAIKPILRPFCTVKWVKI